ncbi:hypothetical protein PRIPAC_70628 [Pristionchus pacificus]|nr:hypothetical protein PRIPAC_70628 [Pristionchus pacificus]
MPFRSFVDGNICYFAITNKVSANRGDLMCSSVLSGSRMFVEKRRDSILKKLFLDVSEYHDLWSTDGKNVLCATLAHGDMTLPGRCLIRSDEPMTWAQASTYCYDNGASSVVIHNELENSVIAERQTPADLKCSDDPQHAIIANNARSKCAASGQWKVDDAKNNNFDINYHNNNHDNNYADFGMSHKGPRGAPNDSHLWPLSFFYNWGRILHGFAATYGGYEVIQRQGVWYERWNGAG